MKNSSSLIIGVAIIIAFTILGLFLMVTFEKDTEDGVSRNPEYRYELIPANENTIIIFDKESGKYWHKFLQSDDGPTNWVKENSPIQNANQ